MGYSKNKLLFAVNAYSGLERCAIVFSGITLITSAFHFWPFGNNKIWQVLCPPNSVSLMWIIVLAFGFIISRQRGIFKKHLPHISILSYLLINLLSFTFSPDIFRSMFFVAKLMLVLVGSYTLFSFAAKNRKQLTILYVIAIISLSITVFCCVSIRYFSHRMYFGFFDNGYKYGTYIGMLTPLCAVFLILSDWKCSKLLAVLLIICSLVSSGSFGAICAISAGLLSSIIFISKWSTKLFVIFSLAVAVLIIPLLWSNFNIGNLRRDLNLKEKDDFNLRQRYLEWQAEINLLEDLMLTGTGAGCINEYRSKYYYRLPKLNTLEPFDQNGWLAIVAEVGILGLICFCWIINHSFKLVFSQIKYLRQKGKYIQQKFAIAGFAGLVGACIANVFSSVYYNGVLIIFVFILVLIEKNNQLLIEE